MKNFIHIFVFILILLLSSLTFADPITLEPSDDMYTDVEHPGTPPTITELWVANYSASGHYERIMIQFDLSDYEGNICDSALLYLDRFFSCPSGGATVTGVYPITEEWNEETWDPHTHIQYDQDQVIPFTFSGPGGDQNTWFEIDITEFANDWLNGNMENHGLVIIAQSGSKFSKFYSKEHTNPNYHPYMELTIDTAIDDKNTLVAGKEITHYSFPNPFNPETTIKFNIPESESGKSIKLSIYNMGGELVKVLLDSQANTGVNSILWDGKNSTGAEVGSGMYFYNLVVGEKGFVKSILLLK